VVDAPHLLVTKFVAWHSRGQGSLYHHDLEDILAVVDGRAELEAELAAAPADVRAFVSGECSALLDHPDMADTVLGFCRNDARAAILLGRLRRLADL
jgi:hypothetical protein